MRLAISFPHGMVLQFPPRVGGGGWAAPTRRQPGVARPPACFAAFGRKTPPPPPPPPGAHKQQPPQKGGCCQLRMRDAARMLRGGQFFHLSAHRLEIGFQGFRVIRRETFI